MIVDGSNSRHWSALRRRIASVRPESAAGLILRTFQIEDPPVNVKAIAEQMSVPVRMVRNPGWSGAVSSSVDTAVIWVNVDEALVRQRFTIAHEIGHLMLHENGVEYRDGTFSGGPQETEANAFAAALLMPAFLLEPLAHRPWKRASSLADLFRVSEQAMRYRLANVLGGRPEDY